MSRNFPRAAPKAEQTTQPGCQPNRGEEAPPSFADATGAKVRSNLIGTQQQEFACLAEVGSSNSAFRTDLSLPTSTASV
eukprot:2715985-Amphidinium_carterae.3